MDKKSGVRLSIPASKVALLELFHPEGMNSLTFPMIEELESHLNKLEADDNISVVLLTGEGRSFCSGGDLKAMREKSGLFAGDSLELMKNYQRGIQRIPLAMERFRKPLIALVNGPAIGAGCDMALMCDIRLASEKAKMGETFVKLGIIPGDGGAYFLTRAIGYAKAMELILTGKVLSASECLDLNLVSQVYPVEKLVEEGVKLASQMAESPLYALEMNKSALKMAYQANISTYLDAMSAYQGMAQRTQEHFDRIS